MIGGYIKTFVAIILAVAALCGLILLMQIGRIDPIPNTMLIDEARVCADPACSAAMPTSLPYYFPISQDGQLRTQRLTLTFDFFDWPTKPQAIYIPKYGDTLGVTLNGQVLSIIDNRYRSWAMPAFFEVPPSLFKLESNSIDIVLSGRPTEGMELYPVYVGDRDYLHPEFQKRYTIGPAAARFTLVCTSILSLMYLLVWGNRRHDTRYLWLGLANASACVVLLHFGYGVLWGGYKTWTGAMHLSIALFVFLNMKFIFQSISLRGGQFERCIIVALIVVGGSLFFISEDQIRIWSLCMNVITGMSAVTTLSLYWIHRDRVSQLDFCVIFTCLLLATALGFHDMILNQNPSLGWTFNMFHFVPICLSVVSSWVIVWELLRSLRRYENLTHSLNDTLAEKSQKLERSFAHIAAVERREAVDLERNRIMLDLHDGIGGQLVSTLAYMETTGNTDATLKDALKAALQDLALVLDSLDSYDSLTTLLGMLRTRLEPLLAEHGLRFNWQIMDDPIVPNAGPSSNLHMARIVQEAITNVIKHANASTITVYADANTILIADDGVGISADKANAAGNSGRGLPGMRHRATSMQALFDIAGTEHGTSITLRFLPAVEQNETETILP